MLRWIGKTLGGMVSQGTAESVSNWIFDTTARLNVDTLG